MKMPWGKYCGCELRELPDQYLDWLTGTQFNDPVLKSAARQEWEQRRKRPPVTPAPLAVDKPDVARIYLLDEEIGIFGELIEAGFDAVRRRYAGVGNRDAVTRIDALMTELRNQLREDED